MVYRVNRVKSLHDSDVPAVRMLSDEMCMTGRQWVHGSIHDSDILAVRISLDEISMTGT